MMLSRDLPKEFCMKLIRNRDGENINLCLGAMVEPVVQIGEDGRCWVYESYRDTLGLGGLTGLIPLYGPTDIAGVQHFLEGYRAGVAVDRRMMPALVPVIDTETDYQI